MRLASACESVPFRGTLRQEVDVLVAGSIDYEEFLAATVNLNHLEKEDTMYNAFRHFDSDNSGYISQAELEDALMVRPMSCLGIDLHVNMMCLQASSTQGCLYEPVAHDVLTSSAP